MEVLVSGIPVKVTAVGVRSSRLLTSLQSDAADISQRSLRLAPEAFKQWQQGPAAISDLGSDELAAVLEVCFSSQSCCLTVCPNMIARPS